MSTTYPDSGSIDKITEQVLYWADHGWALGEQSMYCKMANFELQTRVPTPANGNDILVDGPRIRGELLILNDRLIGRE